jgi:hypothetical protein
VGKFQHITDKIAFLTTVWPRQLSARTPAVVGRLCSLAFADAAHFPELVDAVLPLVSGTNSGDLTLPFIHDPNATITQNHPEKTLMLLAAVLTDDARSWPYGVERLLEGLLKAKPALADDMRFIRLKALWEGR